MARPKGSKNKPAKPAKSAKASKTAGVEKKPAAKASEGRRVIGKGQLTSLLESCRTKQTRMNGIGGTIREEIGYAVEHNHLNKGVFSLIRRMDKMEAEKLAIFLDDLEHYLDISGLIDRAESAPSLGLKPAEAEEGDEAEDGGGDKPGAAPVAADSVVSRPKFGNGKGKTGDALTDAVIGLAKTAGADTTEAQAS